MENKEETKKDEQKEEQKEKEKEKPVENGADKKEETKEEKKEDPKEEETKEEKKEEKKEDIKEVEKKEEKKEESKDENKANNTYEVPIKVEEKSGIKNMVEDSFLLSAVKTWDELGIKPEIKKGLLEMNFVNPSKIQSTTFPLIMKEPRLNLVAQAKNGSGKTGAFGIGVISSIDENSKNIQAVVFAHTRELVNQIQDVLSKIAKYTKVKVTALLSGETSQMNMDIL